MTILDEFEGFLGGDIVVGKAVIGFIPNKEAFSLTMRCRNPAVGKLFDLGEFILLRCKLTFNECSFQENEDAALYFGNAFNLRYNWIKIILNKEHKLELKAEALIDENDWCNEVLRILEVYVDVAAFLYERCEEYGEF